MQVFLHAKSHVVADLPGFVREGHENKGPHEHVIDAPRIADADLSAEEAGRLCYLSGHRPNPKTATNGRYLLNICAQKHYSVLGHASASFYIETSRNCTHEIIRHRWFTFSEVSQRFVDANKLGFESHPGLEPLGSFARDQLEVANRATRDAYEVAVTDLTEAEYSRKQARQAARSILPGGTQTMILMSGNIRAWRDFLAQRLSPHADAEIRAVAYEIYKIMKAEFPNSFIDFDSRGMITTERLIARALERYDQAQAGGYPRRENSEAFVADVREIQKKGLWILEEDPWDEEKIGSNI